MTRTIGKIKRLGKHGIIIARRQIANGSIKRIGPNILPAIGVARKKT